MTGDEIYEAIRRDAIVSRDRIADLESGCAPIGTALATPKTGG